MRTRRDPFEPECLHRHDRYTVFQMAEVAVSRDLFRRILELIDDIRPKRIAPC